MYLVLPVVQPCLVDLDLAWLDVNRICACVFCGSCCLTSLYLMLPVEQPCQVDLDLAWLDVNRIFARAFRCSCLIQWRLVAKKTRGAASDKF